MKQIIFFVFVFFISMTVSFAQENNALPNVTLRDMQGKQVQSSILHNDGNPIILSFWATWCKPCVREFSVLNDVYEDWQDETGVKIIAISIDDARTSNNVVPFVNAKGWDFDFYLDTNHDFKRAMNVNLVPHTFILNGNGEVVWQHTSFSEGGENEMFRVLKEIVNNTKEK
jgi:cytochrome c biogenesis protein CcmG/thiol:disulfide interchange protein DsbE